ncbi:acyltransferase [Pseudomonas sp. C9-3]|uniref:acyltransferase family protein n=1 Tax=Pseudomonas sp. C9-3 TaxID=3078264 RepID=UPI0028EF852E|nr:acyltransferase [Pseudomonas sp. C9-3]
MRARQIDSLTSLRFVAAALVVIFHSKHNFGGYSFADHFSLTQAVSMFYVLSGFILSHTHKNITSKHDLGIFYISRFARIWPLHIATAISAIYIIKYYDGAIPIKDIILNFTLLQSWVPDQATYFSLNGVSWSLSNEIFFYAVFPLLIFRIEKTWALKLISTAAATGLMLYIFRNSDRPLMLWSAYISPLSRLSEFMLGIAAYQIYLKINKAPNQSTLTNSALEIAALSISAAVMWIGDLNFFSSLPIAINKSVSIWFANCGGSLAFALLIVILAKQGGALSKAMSAKPLVYLGEISFSIYMVHQIIIRVMEMYQTLFAGLSQATILIIYFTSVILVSAATHSLIEKPVQKLIISTLTRRNTKPDTINTTSVNQEPRG